MTAPVNHKSGAVRGELSPDRPFRPRKGDLVSAGNTGFELSIDLQEGFSGQEVIIRLGDVEVFRQTGIKTRLDTGRAAGWSGPTRAGLQRLQVEIPELNAHGALAFEAEHPAYVGVKFTPEDGFSFLLQEFPFRYM